MTAGLPADTWILAGGVLLVAAILAAGFAGKVRIPGLLLFLALGMLIADDGLALVQLSDVELAQTLGTVGLLLILFEGGLTTKPGDVRRAAAPALLLASAGVVVTASVVALAGWWLLGLDPLTAMLIGAVVSSTDAAAVFAVLRRAPLPRRLSALLEVESGANDPVAIMLTVGLVATFTGSPQPSDWVAFGLAQVLGGIVAGAVVGLGGSWLLSRATLGPTGVYPVLALGVAGLAYGAAAVVGGSGFLAVYLAGLLVGARVTQHRREIRTFHDGLSSTAEVGLFLMLGMLVFPSQLPPVAGPALLVTVVLVLVARPLAVGLCLVWFGYTWREIVFVSWVGLRGAVPIVLATFPAVAGYPEGALIFNVVFFVVLTSAAVQGISIRSVARVLGITAAPQDLDPVTSGRPLVGTATEIFEVPVRPDLALAGRAVADVAPPCGRITAVVRGQETLDAEAQVELAPGDVLVLVVPRRPDAARQVTAWARGETVAEPSSTRPERE
ncbi:potassium/proton antiporter (CPA1 family) [Isoptericola sp. CG 20/1183]|uniref:Potassium/proton antiporter (CPA1 family) n=1 Tax=Isoptericola halotolerans TaxID=300560 RepID=A0ABX5EBP9_9MICO|nr:MULTISPECIES: potassium/proton antiporter [Isoptericola]PRZ04903.1 potassium/proton antiporter (CPA1 family) [Isoptericola halotolerans]PRZ05394.1 potassium/proton antiporter (CPA1 family) [Isoptericola sp. CG 20/1183]